MGERIRWECFACEAGKCVLMLDSDYWPERCVRTGAECPWEAPGGIPVILDVRRAEERQRRELDL